MLTCLTVEQVIEIHAEIQDCALLDSGKLQSAVWQPFASFGGVDLYPTIFQKAGCLLRGITAAHAFEDGNKRTAWISTVTFLGINGVQIEKVRAETVTDFVVNVTVGRLDVNAAAIWFVDRSV